MPNMSHMNPARNKQNTLIILGKNWCDETDWKFSAMIKASHNRVVRGITCIPEHFPVFGYQLAS
jgi:hypothetical protein